MDDQYTHHVVESVDQLLHDFLNNDWADSPLSNLHELFEVASVGEFHEDVVSSVCLDGFSHSANELALDGILILYLRNDQ